MSGNIEVGGPVFVVGMNGSGTTMLADSLGRHPDLYMFPFESKLIPDFLSRATKFGDLSDLQNRRRLAAELGRTKPLCQANGWRPLLIPDEELSACTGIADVIDAVFRHMAARVGKHTWGEKSPVNTEHIEAMAEAFPSARFLHIIRDGRDAAQSFHRRWGFDPLHTVWRWKKRVQLGRQSGSQLALGRYMEVSYESITADPEPHMRAVCEFLGIAFDVSVLGSSMRHMSQSSNEHGQGKMIVNSEKWRTYFSVDTTTKMEELAGLELSANGYSVDIQGDSDLPPSRQKILRIKDRITRSAAFFREHGLGGSMRFIRVVRSALAQSRVRRF